MTVGSTVQKASGWGKLEINPVPQSSQAPLLTLNMLSVVFSLVGENALTALKYRNFRICLELYHQSCLMF